MPIQFDNFEQQKVDNLKNHLVSMAQKQKAKFYEIYVDSLKAVPKTDEPSEFDGYEDYLTPESNQIKIVIYSGNSPRNDQYVFALKGKTREDAILQTLEGLPVKSFSRNSLHDLKVQMEKKSAEAQQILRLKDEIAQLNEEIEDKDEYIEDLEEAVKIAKANGNKIGGINVSDVISAALEGMLRRNTHLLAEITGVQGLAGIIERDNARLGTAPQKNPDTQVSFKSVDSEEKAELPEHEKQFIAFLYQLQQCFTEQEFTQAINILEAMSKNTSLIPPVLEVINKK